MIATAPTVCAIVVTYNRRELLVECLEKLQAQTRPPDRILVVDNASTDDTLELLSKREGVDVLALDTNGGGAGGFEAGLREARRAGHDWYWLLDDDTFAEPDCLEQLLAGVERAPSPPAVMTSVVRWKDGSLHPMNWPWLRLRHRGTFALGAGAGLAPDTRGDVRVDDDPPRRGRPIRLSAGALLHLVRRHPVHGADPA